MSAIEREQENTIDKINWFTTLNNVPTDFHAVEFQIWDISGGLPGTVIFPTPGDSGDWEDVTSGAGHFGVGSYYAYDNTLVQGWTPSATEPIGTHRIKWRWKVTSGSAYQSSAEDFEVLSVGAGPGPTTYIEVQDVRDEGLLEADYPDARVLTYIEVWQALIERACRQWFLAKQMILEVDGNESDTLFFGVPIIDIEYVKLNGSSEELHTSLYRVYNSQQYPDDRRNPKICLIGPDAYQDIYVAPIVPGEFKFKKGRKNQEIKGTFGFVEEDGVSPPAPIKRALLKLVIEKLANPPYGPADGSLPPTLGALLEEKTDDHSRKYAHPGGELSRRRPGLTGITNDQEILDILKLYRAPLGIAAPKHWSIY
jgi:hypothetical protein